MQTRTLLAGLAALTFVGAAGADVITASSITYTGTGTEAEFVSLESEGAIIDGSGLSAPLAANESNLATVTHADPIVGAGAGNAWATNAPGGGGSDYFAQAGPPTVVFGIDLGDTYTLDQFAYWGYGFGATNGNAASSVTLDFSTDGGGSFDSSQVVSVALIFPTADISALTPVDADFVRLTVTDNHFGAGGANGGGDRVGIAEIAFTGDLVPEPGSLALLGLGGLMIARRRRA